MIVECSHCQTRFRLDESRVPLRGIRVRCSRCKQAFFLQHPSASEAEATHDVAAQAAGVAALESTQDLPPESSVASSPDPGDPEEEDWEFNQDPPDEEPNESSKTVFMDPGSAPVGPITGDAWLAGGSGLDLAGDPHAAEGVDAPTDNGFKGDDDTGDFGEASDFSALADDFEWDVEQEDAAAPARPTAHASAAVSIEDMGEPEDWDFFSDESLEPPSSLEPMDDAMARATAMTETGAALRATDPGPEFVAVQADSSPRLRGLRGAGRMLGWLVTVALCGLGIGRGVFQVAPAGSASAAVVDFGDLQVGEIRTLWLETARSTRMYVVHGRLLNDGSRVLRAGDDTRIALLSSQGERLEIAAARSGLPLSEEQLRMLSAGALAEAARVASSRLAGRLLEPGQAVEFQAFFDEVPDEATSFLVEMAERRPAPEDVTTNPSPASAL